MMKNYYSLFAGFCLATAAVFFCGCAPQVYVSAGSTRTPLPKDAPVVVYSENQEIPSAVEKLGTVSVESSLQRKNGFAEAVGLTRQAAAEAGGNAVRIVDHFIPDEYAPQRVVSSEILRLPDSLYTAVTGSDSLTMKNFSAFDPHREVSWNKSSNHMVYLNAGYDFILTKIYYVPGISGTINNGFGINGGYQWTSLYGIGCGFRYSGYFSSLLLAGDKLNVGLHYFAPEFVLRQDLNKRWRIRESLGVGLVFYHENSGGKSAGRSGVGYHLALDAECKVSKHIGIGVSAAMYAAHLSLVSDWYTTESAYDGLTRISLSGGVRFYF